jgi:hypothetical protein
MWIGGKAKNWLVDKLIKLLVWDKDLPSTPFCDFEQTRFEIRPCDVLLVEGRSRISDVIKTITLSRWTHAALYIGRLNDIENQEIRKIVRLNYPGDPDVQLLIEALVGEGIIISPIAKYQYHNLRICRPRNLMPHDSQKIVEYAVKCVGMSYDTRQLLDLARFLFPYGVLPRKWRSSLFEQKVGESTRTICSTMLAEAFASVQFPVLPFVQSLENGKFRWFNRNSSLFIPSDFDYSPYFEIIKYPFFGDDLAIYKRLPWDKTGVIYSHEHQIQLDMKKNDSQEKTNGKKETTETHEEARLREE